MEKLAELKKEIDRVGVKEIARRADISASTVSRVKSSSIEPSFEVIQKISKALGYHVQFIKVETLHNESRLSFTVDRLTKLRKYLRSCGVQHAYIFGSVARKEDKQNSDIDLYLKFKEKPKAAKMLLAEGSIIEEFGNIKVDIVSWLNPDKDKKLKQQIDKDGICVF